MERMFPKTAGRLPKVGLTQSSLLAAALWMAGATCSTAQQAPSAPIAIAATPAAPTEATLSPVVPAPPEPAVDYEAALQAARSSAPADAVPVDVAPVDVAIGVAGPVAPAGRAAIAIPAIRIRMQAQPILRPAAPAPAPLAAPVADAAAVENEEQADQATDAELVPADKDAAPAQVDLVRGDFANGVIVAVQVAPAVVDTKAAGEGPQQVDAGQPAADNKPDDAQKTPAADAAAGNVEPAADHEHDHEHAEDKAAPAADEGATDEEADDDEAAADEGVAEAVAQAANDVNWHYFSDGVMRYMEANGQIREQRTDALQQLAASFPNLKFVRTFPGDTFAKLAQQHNVALETLSKLNRLPPETRIDQLGVICLDWKYKIIRRRSLAQLAKMLNTTEEVLRTLNNLGPNEEPRRGSHITIPGQYTYQFSGTDGYLQVAMYDNPRDQNLPFKAETVKMNQQMVNKDQTLEDFAKAHQVEVDFLKKMNGIGDDEKIAAGTYLMVEYTVELKEGETLDSLSRIYPQLDRARLLAVNGWEDEDDVDLTKRIQIPIGDQLRSRGATEAVGAESEVKSVEWELGAAE